jgi:hypothetical protein
MMSTTPDPTRTEDDVVEAAMTIDTAVILDLADQWDRQGASAAWRLAYFANVARPAMTLAILAGGYREMFEQGVDDALRHRRQTSVIDPGRSSMPDPARSARYAATCAVQGVVDALERNLSDADDVLAHAAYWAGYSAAAWAMTTA